MKSHELLREVIEKCSPKQMAADLGVSLSLVYKWAEPPEETGPAGGGAGSGATNPLDRVEAILRCTNDERIVQWLCEKAGGFFMKNPKVHWAHPDFLVPATNQIVQEFADMLSAIAVAAGDNKISKNEARDIRARWEELKQVTELFVHCCENGNFSEIREKAEKEAAHLRSARPV